MDKTLTIALQTYNRPKYLSESITSILNQSFEDYELIILDNGSEPDTVSVVKSFQDCRIRYIRNNINDLNFLNKAFEFVNNKFLMIFHDDDVMNRTAEYHDNPFLVFMTNIWECQAIATTGRSANNNAGISSLIRRMSSIVGSFCF